MMAAFAVILPFSAMTRRKIARDFCESRLSRVIRPRSEGTRP
jgi:hypothetical protein